MASLKNSLGAYCREQKQFEMQHQYLHYKYSQIPINSKLPGLGINAGNMRGGYYNNVLSNNASAIESNLYGIRQIDLTKPNKYRAYTRGDGTYGQDITHKIQYINGLSNINN